MRYINKANTPPVFFTQWKNDFTVRRGRRPTFSDLDRTDVKQQLKELLLLEQKYICCYCSIYISGQEDCHMEHIKPQEGFQSLQLDYHNLVLSCNGVGKRNDLNNHCGHKKNNWYHTSMVDPLNGLCSEYFYYDTLGRIRANTPNLGTGTLNSQITIEKLGLDSIRLNHLRKEAISVYLNDEELSKELIEEFIFRLEVPGSDGRYVPFSGAIINYLKKELLIISETVS